MFASDVVKKRFVRREETTTPSGESVISRRISGGERERGVDFADD